MKYFKVNTTSDQIKHSIRFKENFLIANELYTQKEIDKSGHSKEFINKHFTTIETSPKNTHFSFGARFQLTNII